MIDIRLLREHPEEVIATIKRKGQTEKLALVEKIKELDATWRKHKAEGDTLRAERNKISKEVSEAMKAKKKPDALLKKAKEIPQKLEEVESTCTKLEKQIETLLRDLPNLISDKTPAGKSDADNKEIKKWGKIPEFNFPIKTHVELAEKLGIADFDASARVAGSGFYYLKGDLALLNQALIRFVLEFMQKRNYSYIETPLMLKEEAIYASMNKKAIEQSVYDITG